MLCLDETILDIIDELANVMDGELYIVDITVDALLLEGEVVLGDTLMGEVKLGLTDIVDERPVCSCDIVDGNTVGRLDVIVDDVSGVCDTVVEIRVGLAEAVDDITVGLTEIVDEVPVGVVDIADVLPVRGVVAGDLVLDTVVLRLDITDTDGLLPGEVVGVNVPTPVEVVTDWLADENYRTKTIQPYITPRTFQLNNQ